MHKVGSVYLSVYIIGLILAFYYNSISADYIDPIPRDNLFVGNEEYRGDDYEDENDNFGDSLVEVFKRDIIKGPSFLKNIDATTADSDIAFENDEVSQEGSRRLKINAPYHSSLPNNIKPKNNIEDNLDAIETLMKDDSDSWASPRPHHVKDISQFIRHKKTHSDSILDERPAKKNMLTHNDDDLPKKVIKALYDWKVDVAAKGYRKSNIYSNVSSSSRSAAKSSSRSYEDVIPSVEEHVSAKAESPIVVENGKPFLTENGFAGSESDAEPVIPATSIERNNIYQGEKRRERLNGIVKLNVNEAAGRRSNVDSIHGIGSSFLASSSPDAEQAEKRRFTYHLHRRNGHRRSHPVHKTESEEAESGEGSASGAGEASTYSPATFAKPIISSTGTADTSASVSPSPDYAISANTNQDSSATATTIQDNTVTINPNAVSSNFKEDVNAINTNAAPEYPYTQTAQIYTANTASADVKNKEENAETKPKESAESQYNYLNYHASDKSGDDENEASGSGHLVTYGLRGKELNNNELSYKAKVILGYSEGKNETTTKVPSKETESAEKEQTLTTTSKETENAAKNTEVKDAESETSNATTDVTTEQENKSESEERSDAVESNKEQQVSEVHKEESEQGEKSKASALTSQGTSNDDSSSPVSEKKEKTEEASSNTDGTDNMKKKTAQEDKYETLEEVREKFKKWESTIVKTPNDASASDDGNSDSGGKGDESESTVTKSDEPSTLTAKTEESANTLTAKTEENANTLTAKTEENANTLTAKTEENANTLTAKTEENASPTTRTNENNSGASKSDENNNGLVVKPDMSSIAVTKSEGTTSTATKTEENNNLPVKLSESKPAKTVEQSDEKKSEELGKVKIELFTEKKVNNIMSTGKGEAMEKVPEEAIMEKQPDDLVKELIGIPTKPTPKLPDAKGKENIETATKSTQETKPENEVTSEGGKAERSETTAEGGKAEKSETTVEGGKAEKSETTVEGGKAEKSETTVEGGKAEKSETTVEGGKAEKSETTVEGGKAEKSETIAEGGKAEKSETTAEGGKAEKSKAETKEEEKGSLNKSKSEGEEKFNMEEVSKKNKEHHDIPDSDMKEETPEKVNLKGEDLSNLNSSNVPGVNEQPAAPEEKTITETTTPQATTQQEASTEEKSPAPAQSVEEKISDKVTSVAPSSEEKPAKSTPTSEDKQLTKTSNTATKHGKGKQAVEKKPAKEVTKVEKKTSKQQTSKGKTAKVEKEDFSQAQEQQPKKASTEEPEGTTEFNLEQEKPMVNTQITKEANEFSNEQEKSFASAIEKIKAQEEKLKGKEISSEIQDIKEDKNNEKENEIHEEKFGKGNEEETVLSAKSKKHPVSTESKKPSEKNLKQLRLYKHQILSEVEKIDDLMNEYQKDGHSTKELSEAKEVLENDLKLVKELERNTKKKTFTAKKEKIKEKKEEKDREKEKEKEKEKKEEKEIDKEKQLMPTSAYLNAVTDDNKEELQHRDKTNSVDSKSLAKSLEKEAERNEKQLANLIPSYEYYFHSESKPSKKPQKKQSLEEIHKLLKAEIKRLRQKKNSKADNQLKNIRKLVQQHLKKLISTGDIDKTAFHSLAPEIKQLGELLKERIKSLKKKKIARKIKAKKYKENVVLQNMKNDNKKANEQQQPTLESSAATNDSRVVKVKTSQKQHHHAASPESPAPAAAVDKLEPPLNSVKGVDSASKVNPAHNPETPVSHGATETATASQSDNKPSGDKAIFNETIMSAISDTAKANPESQSINIKNLLQTLNEKLGSVYQKAKEAHDIHVATNNKNNYNNAPTQTASETSSHQAPVTKHHAHSYEENPSPPAAAPAAPAAPPPAAPVAPPPAAPVAPPPAAPVAPPPEAAITPNQPLYTAQKTLPSSRTSLTNNAPGLHAGDQRQNVEMVSAPQVIDATETPAAPMAPEPEPQIMTTMVPNNAPMQAEPASAAVDTSFQAATQTINLAPEAPPPPPAIEPKAELPMVPEEPEFEEDTTEALASLEPINTLVETLEKDITELWSYKDLYPNAEALGLDNEKVHNTYANLGSLSGLSLRRALNRALRGEDVGLGVVGGSISKGGPFSEKGLEYVLRSYFYAIEDYWNKVIRPITGSSMIVRDVSLGGISTDYYSFCIRNHLPDDKLTNIVLWELSANDMRRYDDSLKPKPQPLEQFTRNILTYRAKPSLIFVNFFALFDWDPDLRANCRNFEDEGEDDVAKYYKITSLSWRNMVCPLLKSESNPIFTRTNLFAEDHFHPSILGHAQMSYIVIDYIRTEFLKNLVKMRPFFIGDAVEKLQIPRSVYMPRPMFKETFLWKPLCYTYMLVDNRLPNNTMPLHEENESDFKYTVVRGFKIRSDKIAGMETKLKDQFIRYKLQIPRHEDGGLTPFKQLGIMSFTDDRYAEVQFDSQHPSRLEAKKRFLEGTVVKTIAENIEPGDHTLTVRSGDSGFLICALVLG